MNGRRVTAAVLGVVVALVGGAVLDPAHAVSTALPSGGVRAGAVTYTSFKNDVLIGSAVSKGFGVWDATEHDQNRDDALDGGMHLTLNNKPFKDADGTVDISPDTAKVGATGKVLTASGKAGVLKVKAEVAMFGHTIDSVARVLYRIKNPTSERIKVNAVYTNGLGSDDRTVVERTSDGSSSLDSADSWVITSDDGEVDDDVISDPANTIVFGDRPHTYEYSAYSLGISDILKVKSSFVIKPGKTVQLLYFQQFENAVVNAEAAAEPEFDAYANINPLLKVGLTPPFANWNTP